MRELLGELLLEMGQAAAALREFEAALEENSNRFRGLQGAAHAAAASPDPSKAAQYYKQLRDLTRDADTQRPEMTWAANTLRGVERRMKASVRRLLLTDAR